MKVATLDSVVTLLVEFVDGMKARHAAGERHLTVELFVGVTQNLREVEQFLGRMEEPGSREVEGDLGELGISFCTSITKCTGALRSRYQDRRPSNFPPRLSNVPLNLSRFYLAVSDCQLLIDQSDFLEQMEHQPNAYADLMAGYFVSLSAFVSMLAAFGLWSGVYARLRGTSQAGEVTSTSPDDSVQVIS